MKKQIIHVSVLHNVNLMPLSSATVCWSQHYSDPAVEHSCKPGQCKNNETVTNRAGVATITTEIEASEPDSFKIPFKYYNKIWVRIDSVNCYGFKNCEVNKVFPAIGEEYNGSKSTTEYNFTVYLIPQN
ncbi:MAG: hypothetical protein JXB48_24745 [Candidatus Latescibacteria bacterium]|nr:hypothetical protein [Candidatus Latescibacterota bacterium]